MPKAMKAMKEVKKTKDATAQEECSAQDTIRDVALKVTACH